MTPEKASPENIASIEEIEEMAYAGEPKRRPIYRFLIIQAFVTAIAFQGWTALYTNFAVEIGHFTGVETGIVQSIREIPGLLSASLLFFLLFISETRLVAISVLLIGLGTGLTGFFPSFYGIAICTFIMSTGFHYYDAINQSLTLQYFSISESPMIIGRTRSATAAGSFFIGGAILLVSNFCSYQVLFWGVGALAIAGGLWGMLQKPQKPPVHTQHNKLIVRKKYWLFYLLTLLSGARRQIFIVFSVFLLVSKFDFTLRDMAFLFLLNHLINWILNRFIGKIINHVGESKLLTMKYLVLFAIFLAYAYTDSALVVMGLYITEQFFFNFTISIRTFFQKIAEPKDIAPSMALGVTINHIIAVVLPAVGGALWMLDYRIPFFMGAAFALLSIIAVQFMDKILAQNGIEK